MKTRTILVSTFISISAFWIATGNALAFCGVIQESAVGKNVARASQKAENQVRQKIKSLRQQHGRKLQAENAQVACEGGAVAIDANGNQMVGKPSCTATVAFCVNP